MPYIKGTTATLRNGRLIPGGVEFYVSDEELPDWEARDYTVSGDVPETKSEPEPTEAVEETPGLPEDDPLAEVKVAAEEKKDPAILNAKADDKPVMRKKGK